MTTARDLMIIALDAAPSRPVEQGDLSLALAGAEAVDLLAAEALALDGDRIVPRPGPATGDPLLDQAVSSLVRETPYELVGDWLWRRGRGLSAAYLAELESEGLFGRKRRRGLSFRTGRDAPADSPVRRAAAERLASDEPVLAALASALGIRGDAAGAADAADEQDGTGQEAAGEGGNGDVRDGPGADSPGVSDDVDTVLAAVLDALTQLEAIRQRRAVEQAAFDNIWRGD
ncbi:GOLPH3/VPS74 family protein [Streptomyces wuyuanensis]|uniref:Golgi phosphoprotein 3 (GPP34) n=1 Tax=Streptomyces wuyuanensis TaxID=1196353 RepID=A0A1G9N1S4_9ACTN|nr:GPP34 family phosphoprotein [Streptomyces wuyuanensis]SDL80211.1 Golgi phosphoprotein 3 (GPP34) [Streptomyces wuyuanensis]